MINKWTPKVPSPRWMPTDIMDVPKEEIEKAINNLHDSEFDMLPRAEQLTTISLAVMALRLVQHSTTDDFPTIDEIHRVTSWILKARAQRQTTALSAYDLESILLEKMTRQKWEVKPPCANCESGKYSNLNGSYYDVDVYPYCPICGRHLLHADEE